MSESLSDEMQFDTIFNWPSGTFDMIESVPEMQSPERQFNTISHWPGETSTSPILPPNMETLSETQPHERQDISQHIRQQNVDGAKTRKTRSQVWEDFDKYTDENGKDRARCKICKKDLDGSSKSGTTHLKNHFKSCKRKRNEGGGGDNLAGNLSDTNAIKGKSVMDQQLNCHLVSDEVRMMITEERSKRVHDATRAPSTERGQSHSLRTIKVGPWPGGVLGGTAWDFKSDSNAVIKDIVINHGHVVDSVTFTSIHRTTGDIIAKKKFGGTGGHELDQISINRPEEYLTLISGTINQFWGHTVIESLTFYTNRKTYGPYGYTRGDRFETPLENGEIVGFFGRAGLFLNAIGFYVIPSAN